MVKPKKLTEKDQEALKKIARYKIAGPGSKLSIDFNKIGKIAEKIRVEPQITDG